MRASLSTYTALLADSLCGGSSRRLIAGWWYVGDLDLDLDLDLIRFNMI
jgi:hypothetical protein